MKKTVIYIILSGWMFAGCGTYSRYHRPDLSTENLYRDVPADIDTTTIASLSWREMFTDPKLQSLIETEHRPQCGTVTRGSDRSRPDDCQTIISSITGTDCRR